MKFYSACIFAFLLFTAFVFCDGECNITNLKGTKSFLDRIFKKYGNSSDYITNEQFRDLVKNLYLGAAFFECEVGDTECKKNALIAHGLGTKLSKVDSLNSEENGNKTDLLSKNSANRKRRTSDNDENPEHQKEIEQHTKHWQMHLEKCLKPDVLLSSHDINNTNQVTKEDFVRLCPSLLEQIDAKVCVHMHTKEIEYLHGSPDGPTIKEVWGYGMLSITVISLLSLSVISMIPCLKKSFYHKIMAYLVALAVGTLAGDAMLHLIPHAFAEGVNAATNLKVSAEEQIKQHYSQVWRALFVLLGIYIFFLIEQLMKIKAMYCGGKDHGHSHASTKPRSHSHNSDGTLGGHSHNGKDTRVISKKSPSDSSMAAFIKDRKEIPPNTTNDVDMGQVEVQLRLCESDEVRIEEHGIGDHQHDHHHAEKVITKDTKIASVAWMVVVGDGFHNFSDGLAVGAAFSASLSSGLSTAIAVFCHELPHELGDFALLINSGMTYKQAIVYNMVSAVLAYIGLVVGILIGENETGRHFILSITAGLFLYISLADMLPELTHQEVPYQSQCSAFICQHLGILSGIGIMLVISLYEHIM